MPAVVAPRYARAFAQVAEAAGLRPEDAQAQMASFAGVLAGSPELREVMSNPAIPQVQKNRVLDALAERLGVAQPVRNFIVVIVQNDRLSDLDEIRAEYAAVAAAGQHVVEAEVESAQTLGDAEKQALAARARELAGGDVRLSWRENPELLGGAVLRIGSTVYDGSLRAQLESMKRALMAVPMTAAAGE